MTKLCCHIARTYIVVSYQYVNTEDLTNFLVAFSIMSINKQKAEYAVYH